MVSFKNFFRESFLKMILDDEFWVDQVSKILFPSAFFLFNLAFWCFAIFGNQGDLENILEHGYIKL